MIKFAFLVPVFGNSKARLNACLRHIRLAVPDALLLVSDDNTPHIEWVREQKQVCDKYEAVYVKSSVFGQMSGNYHTACLLAHELWNPDVFIILQSDFLITKRWWRHLKYFWETNFDKPFATASFPFIEAWEITLSGVIDWETDFYKVDWNERPFSPRQIVWRVDLFGLYKELGIIVTRSWPPNKNFVKRNGISRAKGFPQSVCALVGTTNAHLVVRSSAYFEVGGFEGLPTSLLDLELGWKLWDVGYWNLQVPGPVGLHYGDGGTAEMYKLVRPRMNPKERAFVWDLPEAKKAFAKRWGTSDYMSVEREYIKKYCKPMNSSGYLNRLKFLPSLGDI